MAVKNSQPHKELTEMREWGKGYVVEVPLDATDDDLSDIYEQVELLIEESFEGALSRGLLPKDANYEMVTSERTIGMWSRPDGEYEELGSNTDFLSDRRLSQGWVFHPAVHQYFYGWYYHEETTSTPCPISEFTLYEGTTQDTEHLDFTTLLAAARTEND